MNQYSADNNQIKFSERSSPAFRVFLCLVGLIPFITPYELLIKPLWNELSPMIVIPVIISVGAILVGLMFILAGLLGLNQTLLFDTNTKTALYTYETGITRLKTRVYNFSDIVEIKVTAHEWESRPTTFSLLVFFADKRKVEVGQFDEKNQAVACIRHIQKMIT